ncbi:hypothetical protein ASD52_31055 [Ensifer sp. Root142]|nr:hypothetical protein ASD00_26300 [Ensifer sp. Root31]KQY69891.1 hypothetical protein ASD52_31055 [Ensifer sp. Root142]OMQ42361.1 hypothetical protein BKP54_23605 [Ensifer sp. 1H6]PSS62801.1 hypothetical protein C6558_20460 [Ensifer sp. NM-2]
MQDQHTPSRRVFSLCVAMGAQKFMSEVKCFKDCIDCDKCIDIHTSDEAYRALAPTGRVARPSITAIRI